MKGKISVIKVLFWIFAIPIFIISFLFGKPEDAFLLMKDTCKKEDFQI